MNDISKSILISEIRHIIGIIKTGDIKGGTSRLSQLADNMQYAINKNCELSNTLRPSINPYPSPEDMNEEWYYIAKRLYNVLGLKKSELRVITVQNAFIYAEEKLNEKHN